MKKAKIKERPKCACGSPMKVINYRGYYEGFSYWDCTNKKCDFDVEKFLPDDDWTGNYA